MVVTKTQWSNVFYGKPISCTQKELDKGGFCLIFKYALVQIGTKEWGFGIELATMKLLKLCVTNYYY